MSLWFGFILPAALSFYWTIGTILQIGQDIWLTKKYTKILDEEDAVKAVARKEKEAEIEAKRLETEKKKAEGLVERNSNTSKRKKKKSDRQGQREKAAEWEKKNAPVVAITDDKNEPGRVGNRRYARGRAYDPDRFAGEIDGDVSEAIEGTVLIEDTEDDQVSGVAAAYAGEDVEYVDDSYTDFEGDEDDFEDDDEPEDDEYDDSDDDDDFEDEDEDEFEDDDFEDDDVSDDEDDFEDDDDEDDLEDDDDDLDDDDEDNDDDDDNPAAPQSEKFETKRFD